MQNSLNRGEVGSIKWIILIILALVIASYFFDFNIQEAVEDEQTQSNFNYIKNNLITYYESYLKTPLDFFWNEIVINIIWVNISGLLSEVQIDQS